MVSQIPQIIPSPQPKIHSGSSIANKNNSAYPRLWKNLVDSYSYEISGANVDMRNIIKKEKLTGVSIATSRFDRFNKYLIYDYDGLSDYSWKAVNYNLLGNYTMVCWVGMPNLTTVSNAYFMAFGSNANSLPLWGLIYENTNLRSLWRDNAGTGVDVTGTSGILNDGKLHCCVSRVSLNGTTITNDVFVNGVLEGSTSNSVVSCDVNRFAFGALLRTAATPACRCNLSSGYFYNRALRNEEIHMLAQQKDPLLLYRKKSLIHVTVQTPPTPSGVRILRHPLVDSGGILGNVLVY